MGGNVKPDWPQRALQHQVGPNQKSTPKGTPVLAVESCEPGRTTRRRVPILLLHSRTQERVPAAFARAILFSREAAKHAEAVSGQVLGKRSSNAKGRAPADGTIS